MAIQDNIQMVIHMDQSITPEEEAKRLSIIQYALENDQVKPYYQGLYNNQIKRIDKYEALMRICGPDEMVYPPSYFMAIAKKYDLYLPLNLIMFEKVFSDFSLIDSTVSLNLSPYHLMDKSFCDVLFSHIDAFYKPSNIIFEILEDECAMEIEMLAPFMEKARSYGVKIAIDDFGSGYSNFLSILKIKPDFLKIDGGIIKNVHTCFENKVIVEALADIGKKLCIPLVAEYVENAEIQEVITRYDISYSQGYYFFEPQSFTAIYEAEKSV